MKTTLLWVLATILVVSIGWVAWYIFLLIEKTAIESLKQKGDLLE